MRAPQGTRLILALAACLSLASCAPRIPSWIPWPRRRPPISYERAHYVRRGETLSGIAKRYGVSVGTIMRYNHLRDPDRINVGQRLRIPRRDPVAWLYRGSRPRHELRTASIARPSKLFLWPVRGKITRRFSEDATAPHKGIDIAAPVGTSVKAADGGKVLFSGVGPEGYGQMVIIQHPSRFVTVYAHNQANLVRVGERIARGQRIAYVGKSGNATGPHLHFEVRFETDPRDPLTALPP